MRILILACVAALLMVSMVKAQSSADLVLAKSVAQTIEEDLRYATINNFVGEKIYTDARCWLTRETASKLATAARNLIQERPGYRLKVWDCYRSHEAHQRLWTAWVADLEDLHPDWNSEQIEKEAAKYVARGRSSHSNGTTVDITIVDENGNEVEMPTGFDDFSKKAWPSAPTSVEAAQNRALLRKVMMDAGFSPITTEWWHFHT